MSALLPIDHSGPRPDPADPESRLRRAAEAFEGLLLQTLVSRMSAAHLESGFFGDGPGSSIYEGMFERHLSEVLSQDSPLGIADMLERQWLAGPGNGADADRVSDAVAAERALRTYGRSAPQVFGVSSDE